MEKPLELGREHHIPDNAQRGAMGPCSHRKLAHLVRVLAQRRLEVNRLQRQQHQLLARAAAARLAIRHLEQLLQLAAATDPETGAPAPQPLWDTQLSGLRQQLADSEVLSAMAVPLPPAGLRWSLPGAADQARRSGALRRPDAGAAFAGALHAYLLRSAPLSLRARSAAPQAAADREQLDSLLRDLMEHAAAAALVLGPPDDKGGGGAHAPPPLAAAYARPVFPPLDGGGGGGEAEDEEPWEGRGAMACSVEHWMWAAQQPELEPDQEAVLSAVLDRWHEASQALALRRDEALRQLYLPAPAGPAAPAAPGGAARPAGAGEARVLAARVAALQASSLLSTVVHAFCVASVLRSDQLAGYMAACHPSFPSLGALYEGTRRLREAGARVAAPGKGGAGQPWSLGELGEVSRGYQAEAEEEEEEEGDYGEEGSGTDVGDYEGEEEAMGVEGSDETAPGPAGGQGGPRH